MTPSIRCPPLAVWLVCLAAVGLSSTSASRPSRSRRSLRRPARRHPRHLPKAEANKQYVEDFMAAFSAREDETALGMLSDTATWWVAGDFPLSGTCDKEALIEFLGFIRTTCDGPFRLTPLAFTAEGGRVAVEAESHAKLHDGRVCQQ